MIRPYIANLESRLQLIQSCIGGTDLYKQEEIKQIKTKTSQYISKLHKDTQRKFQRIKKAIDKYGDVIDGPTSLKEKLNIVADEMQELKEIQEVLRKIQKNLPSLNTDEYVKIRQQSRNVDLLLTASELKIDEGGNKGNPDVGIAQYSNQSLTQIRDQHRQEMNQLLELNKRVISNLNLKLEAMMIKKNSSSS